MNPQICNTTSTNDYSDQSEISKNTIIILNHPITNQIDAFTHLGLFTLIIALYVYQCLRIHNYDRNHVKSIEFQFQLLFYVQTLLKIIFFSYVYIGFEIDQQKDWLQRIQKEQEICYQKSIYCDYQFFYENRDKCYVRFEINNLFLIFTEYLSIIIIQMITFLWQTQITPSMFIRVSKVLMNQYISLKLKLLYLYFFIVDLILLGDLLVFQILIAQEQFEQSQNLKLPIIQIIQSYQDLFIFGFSTTFYFLYYIWEQYQKGERLYLNKKLIAFCLIAIIIVRIGLIALNIIQKQQGSNDNYERMPEKSLMYLIIYIIEFLQSVLLIQLF